MNWYWLQRGASGSTGGLASALAGTMSIPAAEGACEESGVSLRLPASVSKAPFTGEFDRR